VRIFSLLQQQQPSPPNISSCLLHPSQSPFNIPSPRSRLFYNTHSLAFFGRACPLRKRVRLPATPHYPYLLQRSRTPTHSLLYLTALPLPISTTTIIFCPLSFSTSITSALYNSSRLPNSKLRLTEFGSSCCQNGILTSLHKLQISR
jgi:hypothetical protein